MQKFQRFDHIEGSRALLAWWVVISHLLLRAGYDQHDLVWPLDIVRSGSYAVQVFMVLSGFVITHLLVSKREPYWLYLSRRFLRIFPVFALVIAAVLVIDQFVNISHMEDGIGRYLIAHLFMLHGAVPQQVVPGMPSAIVGPAWSISLEWQFYLVAPLIVALIMRPNKWLAMVLAIVSAMSIPSGLAFGPYDLTWQHSAFLLTSIEFFLLGIASYLLLPRLPEINLSGVALCVIGVWMLTKSYPLCCWTLILLGFRCSPVQQALSWKPLFVLGQCSFSTYLIHVPVMEVFEKALFLPWIGHRGLALFLCLSACVLVIVPVLSMILYRYVERPAIRFGKRLDVTRASTAEARVTAAS